MRKSAKFSILLLTFALVAVLAACAPAAPAQPAQAPVATEAPKATEAPVATEAPKATEAPVATEAPKATEAPVATEAPAATQVPAATEAPAATEVPAVAPAAVSFVKDVQPIFEQNCVKCHGGSDGIKGGLSLKTYADLMKGGKDGEVIAPGDAANSMLVQAITAGKMPKRGTKLAQEKIDMIAAWVTAGAQNN